MTDRPTLLAAGALALPAAATADDDDGKRNKQEGEFITLPAGAAMGLEI